MFIIPHGAPAGYVAFVVLVGLCFAVCSFMRNAKPLDGLRRERQALPAPNPIHPGPGPEHRLRELQRRFRGVSERHDERESPAPPPPKYVDSPSPPKPPPSPFSRLCESMKDAPPKEQASRVREHFGIVGGARPTEGRGRKGKRP